jgi:hypothetical protein
MFNFSDIYCFIHVSGCVGRGSSALLCPGAYNAVKTALRGTAMLTFDCIIYYYLTLYFSKV